MLNSGLHIFKKLSKKHIILLAFMLNDGGNILLDFDIIFYGNKFLFISSD